VELLVVCSIIAILASMLLPALSKGKQKAQGLQCLSNHRQLTLAWKMYADDNRDQLPYASRIWEHPELDPYAWIATDLDFDPKNRANWDPDVSIKTSPLWAYCGNSAGIWKCPADTSAIIVDGERKSRVRSMSMNVWVGGFDGYDGGLSGGDRTTYGGNLWKIHLKMSDFTTPGPSGIFLFLDMREDSIDWGNFATDMRGWPDQPGSIGFYDLPASYHNRAGGLSFADGHAEIRRWVDERTTPPLQRDGFVPDIFASPNNRDIFWLQEHATRMR
jgi:prepilin-type processing-associated H-X9-DG protein